MQNQPNKTVLGETLTRLRKSYGLTQEQVAEILKIKRSTYAYYERNIVPPIDIISKLATMFSVSTHELMYGEPEEPKQFSVFNDSNSIFPKHSTKSHYIDFSQLSPKEKQLISRFRLLPDTLKEKLLKESEILVDKADE